MSFNRTIMFDKKKISRKKNHRWRKFQKSKKGIYVATDREGKVIAESDSYEEYIDQLNPKWNRK